MSDFISKITITAIDRASAVAKKIGASMTALSQKSGVFGKSIQSVSMHSEKFMHGLREIGVAAGLAGYGIFEITRKAGEMGEELLNTSQRTGVSTNNLQQFRYAAKIMGIEAGSMDNALKFLNKNLAIAATKAGSPQAKAFSSMGISVKDTKGNITDLNIVLQKMSDVFNKSADGPKKVLTAMTTAGRGGTAIIPFLNLGSKALADFGKEAVRTGNVLSKVDLEKLASYDDTVDKVQLSLKGLSNQITVALVPALNALGEGILNYINQNREFIKVKAVEAVKAFGRAIQDVISVVTTISSAISIVTDRVGGLKVVLFALAAYMASEFVRTLVELGFALAKVSAALLLTPFGFYAAGIGAIAFAGYELVKMWPQIAASATAAWQQILGVTEPVRIALVDFISFIASSGLGEYLAAPFQLMGAAIDYVIGKVGSLKGAVSSVVNFPSRAWQGILDATQSVRSKIIDYLPGASNVNPTQTPVAKPFGSSPVAASFAPAPAAMPQNMSSNEEKNITVAPQKIDISMKITAEGRPANVVATSNQPMNFAANTGVMRP